ncbi:MAG TPA: DUF6152 family protein [Gammaproteobacteria bacterium]
MTPRYVFLACAASVAASTAAVAHHSSAAYDLRKEVIVEGRIAKVQWANPHIYLTIETTGADGEPAFQDVEVGPLAAVQTYGLRRDVVAQGSHVVVRANPGRSTRTMRGLDVTTDDGAIYRLTADGRSSRAPAAAVPAAGLAGKWTSTPAAFIELARTAPRWVLTEAGRATPTLRASPSCDAFNPPPALGLVPGLREIEIGETSVVIRYDTDWGEVVRTIRMDGAGHPTDLEPSPVGDSIGWWEGETLVIDSTGFAGPPDGVQGVLFGVRKHLVERLTLAEDRTHLRYEFTLEDPDYLAEPVSYSTLWDHRPDLEPSGVACDPEIARRFQEE